MNPRHKDVPVAFYPEHTVNLSSDSKHKNAYMVLASTGKVVQSFEFMWEARSFRHAAMHKFDRFKPQTSLTKRDGEFIVLIRLRPIEYYE